jgi:hypothetical protein
LFKFLHERYGKQTVIDLWVGIPNESLTNLDQLVAQKGTPGKEECWTHTLTEEGAQYAMTATEDTFGIEMHQCPSVALLQRVPATRYTDCCEHCAWLYPRILERHGFDVRTQVICPQKGVCGLVVKRRKQQR